ncbi:MAG: protein kinase [Myxococcales bacterium]|nr:protein kinase [Myxococcales bacterium]MBL0194569.1 protein kinase [Myxococcales bacterium]
MSEPAQRSDLPEASPSISFGKYQLFASLGRGGMADVFLSVARGPMGFNKLAVVKRLRGALAEERAFLDMFLDEARLAARLNHPNIVHTYEVGEHNRAYFIAMEYLEGQSLNKVIRESLKRKDPLPEGFCARVVADALNGLDHAHKLKDYDGSPLSIIHRDVSPHNIFVTYDGHTKVVDFGIAKAALSSTQTEVGVLKGKVAYMAPEHAMGGAIDQRADVFAMGIVLWEMLAGERLMSGDSAANTLHKLLNVPIPRVSERRSVDVELDEIVARALQKKPDDRWASAGDMRDALEAFLARAPHRHEDVGRRVAGMFQRVREEAQRQVQKHMAVLTAASSTQEVQALTLESLRRMERSGANVSGHLLRLNESGSGMVSSALAFSGGGGTFPSGPAPTYAPPPIAPPPPRTSPLPWALALALLGVVAVVAVVVAFRAGTQRQTVRPAEPSALPEPGAVVAAPGPSTPQATSPSINPTAVLVAGGATPTPPPPVAPAIASSAPPAPTPHVPTAGSTRAPATAKPAPAPKPTAVEPAVEPGYLSFDTYPWTRVSDGGRALGTTPLNRVALSPGTHTLTLENPEQGISKTHVVVIKSGETTRGRLGLK